MTDYTPIPVSEQEDKEFGQIATISKTLNDSDAAWFEAQRKWEVLRLKPGAYTAFKAGYEAGLKELTDRVGQATLDGYDAGFKRAQELALEVIRG